MEDENTIYKDMLASYKKLTDYILSEDSDIAIRLRFFASEIARINNRLDCCIEQIRQMQEDLGKEINT